MKRKAERSGEPEFASALAIIFFHDSFQRDHPPEVMPDAGEPAFLAAVDRVMTTLSDVPSDLDEALIRIWVEALPSKLLM